MSVVDDVRDVPYQPIPATAAPIEIPQMTYVSWWDRLWGTR
ncbi:hypothetical protein [Microbacterium sp. 1P06AB]